MAKRIQLKRTKGWRKPPEAVVVSRPSKWGNPYSRDEVISVVTDHWASAFSFPRTEARLIAEKTWREEALTMYKEHLLEMDDDERNRIGLC